MATYTYTLKYSANGGSGAPSAQSETTSDDHVRISVSSSEPSRTGHRFLGWSKSSSATSATYTAGDLVTINYTAPTVTIYAVWQKRTYTVSYSANGGSGAPSSQTKTYGIDLTLSSTTPTRAGYSFDGWATSASGGAVYSAGDTYSDNASITLYAAWTENAPTTYTVSYNANGGTGAPGSQSKEHGQTITLSAVVPVRAGYDFLGWGTSADATTPSYQPNGSYSANSSVTLYAVWSGAVVPTGAMYHSDGVGITEGEPYIADDGLHQGTAYIVVGGSLKEGK